MSVLDRIQGPRDLDDLTGPELLTLAEEIREFLVTAISRSGGHLGSNLGAVELTIALHRVFRSPHDTILWDTGHQCYVHKLLTGRRDLFGSLRQAGGLSGYPSRQESEHDVIENSHASTALSWADGLAKARALRGEQDRKVVVVVGDGALTGGMCWEAMNNIAAAPDRQVIVVVNDNTRSYAPTIGGLATHLAQLRADRRWDGLLESIGAVTRRLPFAGAAAYRLLRGIKRGAKEVLAPRSLFADLGLKYLGPIDGHDAIAMEAVLRAARDYPGSVIVHCITRKGAGYLPSETHEADRHHAVGPFDPATGRPPVSVNPAPVSWTAVFGEQMLELAAERPDVVAITAAMLGPVGLQPFAAKYPDRIFDVGIAEQHAAASAAGLALGGLHPVVAIYATFLNRCFDQVLMDVALHSAGVTFVLDRAGVTGDDGPSHNGMWDLSMLQVVPGLRIAAPRDGDRLRELLREAVGISDAPTVLRFPKGSVGKSLPASSRYGTVEVLHGGPPSDVLIVGIGATCSDAVSAARLLAAHGVSVTVADPRWIKPVPHDLIALAAEHRVVVTVEDNGRTGGAGTTIAQALHDQGIFRPFRNLGIAQRFQQQGSRIGILAANGLRPEAIEDAVLELLATEVPWAPARITDAELRAPAAEPTLHEVTA